MQKEAMQQSYTSWFDTPFYHILYKDRDDKEAQDFMNHLLTFFNLPISAEILDLACGRGRHSIYLNSLGYTVTGADLSEKSIKHAKQFANDTLSFKEHDMCIPFGRKFDAVFNLFTSFGLFEDENDNLRTIKAIKTDLNESGFGVIDFMNANKVIENLVPSETKTVNGIDFHITRWVENNFIMKNIKFNYEKIDYNFTEKVRALTLKDFQGFFDQANVTLKHTFGDYKLKSFDENTSDRLILIFS